MMSTSKVRLKLMIESEKLSYLTTVCNLYPFAGINTVIRRIPHHGEMAIPLFSPCSLTMVRMAATGRYLRGLMAMPMEMLLGPNGGETRGFSGTCEDRRIRKKRRFL